MDSKDPEVSTNSDPPAEGSRYELKYGFHLDLDYAKSLHGILMAIITVLSLIAFICVSVGRGVFECDYTYGSSYNFFGFVSMSAFLTGLINYIIFMFAFDDKLVLKFVPWNLAIMVWCGIWTFLYLVGSSVVAAKACSQPGNAAGAVFGFILMVLMGVKGFFAFRKFQEQRADGTGPQSSASSPEYSAERNNEQY